MAWSDWIKNQIISIGFAIGWTDYNAPENNDLANRKRVDNYKNWENKSEKLDSNESDPNGGQ